MVQNQPTTAGAPASPWWTPPAEPGPVVSPYPVTHEVSPGGQPIAFAGDPDAGGRDDVAASVAQAVANAEARYHELQQDTGAGSRIGDLMDLPPVTSDTSKHTGSPGSPDSGPAG